MLDDAREPKPEGRTRADKLLVHPKRNMKIGNWNVRSLYHCTIIVRGNVAQAAREMNKRGIDIMGISETHWIGQVKYS